MGTKDARIHTGRIDRNGRARGSRRDTSFFGRYGAPPTKRFCDCEAAGVPTFFCARCRTPGLAEAEARHKGVDGLHPRDEGQEA